ncbi:MAG: aspartate carbamoyltransferase regulatory subunit [Bacteroidales bacterium]|nr:aspartate carbamoyltransferase regulatory subunit [Bacteroidales bacterium]
MEKKNNQLIVNAIENGMVLDHIPSESIFEVIDILGLSSCANQITIGINLESKSLGKKGIIKVADRYFKNDEINRIALVAPKATINVIKDYKVVEKKTISIPDEIEGLAKCSNPLCVTNNQAIKTKFKTVVKENTIEFVCRYCEKTTDIKSLKIIPQ